MISADACCDPHNDYERIAVLRRRFNAVAKQITTVETAKYLTQPLRQEIRSYLALSNRYLGPSFPPELRSFCMQYDCHPSSLLGPLISLFESGRHVHHLSRPAWILILALQSFIVRLKMIIDREPFDILCEMLHVKMVLENCIQPVLRIFQFITFTEATTTLMLAILGERIKISLPKLLDQLLIADITAIRVAQDLSQTHYSLSLCLEAISTWVPPETAFSLISCYKDASNVFVAQLPVQLRMAYLVRILQSTNIGVSDDIAAKSLKMLHSSLEADELFVCQSALFRTTRREIEHMATTTSITTFGATMMRIHDIWDRLGRPAFLIRDLPTCLDVWQILRACCDLVNPLQLWIFQVFRPLLVSHIDRTVGGILNLIDVPSVTIETLINTLERARIPIGTRYTQISPFNQLRTIDDEVSWRFQPQQCCSALPEIAAAWLPEPPAVPGGQENRRVGVGLASRAIFAQDPFRLTVDAEQAVLLMAIDRGKEKTKVERICGLDREAFLLTLNSLLEASVVVEVNEMLHPRRMEYTMCIARTPAFKSKQINVDPILLDLVLIKIKNDSPLLISKLVMEIAHCTPFYISSEHSAITAVLQQLEKTNLITIHDGVILVPT